MGLERGQELSVGDVVVRVLRGGFSEVAILEGPLGTRAMKRLRDDVLQAGGPRLAEQFVQECLTWSRELADAPYVARALLPVPRLDDLGPVLFMEYVEGGSLGSLQRKEGVFTVSHACRMWAQMARALAYAHERGVVHRDLKPNNVLLHRNGEIRLIDWGVSSALGQAGLEAVNVYASPERMSRPGLVDASDDIYMLGVMLIEALTGRRPRHRELQDSVHRTRNSQDVPTAVGALVARMVSPSSDGRPTASELVEALEDPALLHEVRARDIERDFCPSCGFVSSRRRGGCSICAEVMHRRAPRPPLHGMVRIPAGTFTRGLSREQAMRAGATAGISPLPEDELTKLVREPLERTFVPAFDIDEFPVSNRRYADFATELGYPVPEGFASVRKQSPDHPCLGLGWRDAMAFALWAGRRLPTALEWERAARGGEDARSYPWGDVWEPQRCNHSRYGGFPTTTPVAHFTEGQADGRSPFGVVDMVGNVAEWVADDAPYGKVLKGGSYGRPGPIYALISFDIYAEPDLRDSATGVRCARSVEYDVTRVPPGGSS